MSLDATTEAGSASDTRRPGSSAVTETREGATAATCWLPEADTGPVGNLSVLQAFLFPLSIK